MTSEGNRASAVPTVPLPSGAAMPALGFGTWQLTGRTGVEMVAAAVEVGYRLFDTAEEYGNESAVGEGLRLSGMDRAEAFVSTKVYFDHLAEGVLQDHARQSLDRLGTDWLDLLLVHWPSSVTPLAETIAALNDVVDAGVSRAIGVSNFPPGLLKQAVALSRHPLATNQVEYHPALDQSAILAILRDHGMVLTAHTPLGMGSGMSAPVLQDIADRHGATPAQVVLRWLIQQDGVVAIPRTRHRKRLVENLAAVDLALSDEDMARISALKREDGRIVSPPFAPDWNA